MEIYCSGCNNRMDRFEYKKGNKFSANYICQSMYCISPQAVKIKD